MDYYFLDRVPWEHSQSLYHAAAHLGKEVLFILRPASPYVCLGFHQDVEQEIDVEFARANQIPVFRREVGGGAVYLDSGQLFYQLILSKDHPGVPKNKAAFYKKYLEPVIETYRAFGVPATYKPVNDIIANGRKVSGNGAAEINDMLILVGNFILDFNYEMMSKVLKVPDEKFRDKVYKSLSENLSTMKRETGSIPETSDLAHDLYKRFLPLLGEMNIKTTVDPEILTKADELFVEMANPEWVFGNDHRRLDVRQVKIREGVYVVQNMLKTPGGLVRVAAIHQDGTLQDVHLSGDFFFYPADKVPELEQRLEGTPANPESVAQVVELFYMENQIESPGLLPQDFGKVLVPG